MAQRDPTDRRRYPRVHTPVVVRPTGGFANERPGRTVTDISIGGFRVFSDDEYRPGTRLEFDFLLDEGLPAELVAEVVWIRKLSADTPARFDVGFKYVDVTPEVMARIASFLVPDDG